MMEPREREEFGKYLKRLREEAGLTLRNVEEKISISNAFLSQIEKGQRNPPKPNVLQELATVYNVSFESLMAAAGLQEPRDVDLFHDQLERAFEYVRKDKQFRYGTHMNAAELTPAAKRFIIEMYQEMTGLKLIERLEDVKEA